MSYKNAFEALGFDTEEAAVQALRADFAALLRDWIRQRGLTQAAAGAALGVSQSAVSEIVNGQTGRKSIEYFIRLLARVGVAWTARCWHAPSDAAAIKGPAPASWIGTSSARVTRVTPDVASAPPAIWDRVGGFDVFVATGTPSKELRGVRGG